MSLIAKDSGGGEYEQAPEGSFIARCFKIIDLGTQTTEFSNETKSQQKILISWELLDGDAGLNKDGQPFTLSKRYTLSLHEKSTLRSDLQAWRGKTFTAEELAGFDLINVLGKYCQVQIIHNENNGKTYADLGAIMTFKGDQPKPILEDVVFDLGDPDMKVFNGFSNKLKEMIRSSPEGQALETFDGLDSQAPINVNDYSADDAEEEEATEPPAPAVNDLPPARAPQSGWATLIQRKQITDLCRMNGAETVAMRMEFVANELGRDVKTLNEISRDDAQKVIDALKALKDA